jgi:hypothetical protein
LEELLVTAVARRGREETVDSHHCYERKKDAVEDYVEPKPSWVVFSGPKPAWVFFSGEQGVIVPAEYYSRRELIEPKHPHDNEQEANQ